MKTLPRLSLGLTGKCNLQCRMCNIPDAEGTVFDMPDETVERILNTVHTVKIKKAYFCGWGEPFLSPRIFDCLTYFRKLDIPTTVQTNGTLLEELADRIIEERPDVIDVSIHGGDETSYTRVMSGSSLERLIRGLDALKYSGNGYNNRPLVGRFIYCAAADTIETLPRIVELASKYRVREVFVQYIQEPAEPPSRTALRYGDIDGNGTYAGVMEKASESAKDTGVKLTFDRQFYIQANLNKDEHISRRRTRLCTSPWTVMEILHTGEYRVCGYPEMPNIMPLPSDFTLFGLWNDPQVLAVRRGLASGNLHPWCSVCRYRQNVPLHQMKKKVRRTRLSSTIAGKAASRIVSRKKIQRF